MRIEGGLMVLRATGVSWLSTKPTVLAETKGVRVVAKTDYSQPAPLVMATLERAEVDDLGTEGWRRDRDPESIARGLLELVLAFRKRGEELKTPSGDRDQEAGRS